MLFRREIGRFEVNGGPIKVDFPEAVGLFDLSVCLVEVTAPGTERRWLGRSLYLQP